MDKASKILVAGHLGLVGSSIYGTLLDRGYNNLVVRELEELDLTDQIAVTKFFTNEKPDYVFLAAAKVGGILANNKYPADFIRDNILIQTNVIDAAYRSGVKKLLFLGSACIYPKVCPQPIKEEYLLTGVLEPTNEPYAIAKIAGISMCQSYNRQYGTNFISVMPTNLYGPGDNFDLETAHVLPALVRKVYEAKKSNSESIVVWGTGTPTRDFLYVDDLADACIFLMNHYNSSEIINIGTGEDVSISGLVELIKSVSGYDGSIEYDRTKPDGTPLRRLDVSKLFSMGWRPQYTLEMGLKDTYDWYSANRK
ncbi:MAG: GDP-L-fucose synthase family protein [Candidatus Saccharibacteria bacterium]